VRAAEMAARSVLGVALLLMLAGAVIAQDASVSFKRAQHLRHGINLSHWFAQVYGAEGYTKEHFDKYDTAQDMALIKAMGFDHVRFTLNCQPMLRHGEADQIPKEYLEMVDGAVKMILDQGLAVIIDIHPEDDFKDKLARDDAAEEFADFWRALARHYSSYDPNLVFFETLNEPVMRDHFRWNGIQAHLAVAIREGAPQHTIIVEGARWSDDDDLLFMDPLRDANVIYNFHFYEPHLFTHQGAGWGAPWWHYLKGVPYPSTAENVEAVVAQVPEARYKEELKRYGAEQWNAKRIEAEFEQVAAWGKRWNVPLTCNEFGVYRNAAKAEDRAAWIHDVRTALEKYGIGWTMWDYAGGFSVVVRKEGTITPDAVTLNALGLTVPAAVQVAPAAKP